MGAAEERLRLCRRQKIMGMKLTEYVCFYGATFFIAVSFFSPFWIFTVFPVLVAAAMGITGYAMLKLAKTIPL